MHSIAEAVTRRSHCHSHQVSPKLVLSLVVSEPYCPETIFKPRLVNLHVAAHFIERAILVTQFHVHEAQQHHYVIR